jgi:8-oxo-dGTP diphosphatase
MLEDIPQFGMEPEVEYKDRPGAYAVVFNSEGKILSLKVGDLFHLPGGGIDLDEDPQAAVIRETYEEAGCKIGDIEYLGNANQYLTKTKRGAVNKLGFFYQAKMINIDPSKSIEADHEVFWVTSGEFLNSTAVEFQKWAVRKVLEK